MWKTIRKHLFCRKKQKPRQEGILAGEKQWTIERTKRNRRRVREKMCSHNSGTTCPEFFSSGRTLTVEDMEAVNRCRTSSTVEIVSENDEKDWWVPKVSPAEEEGEFEFLNKGLEQWEARRKEWLKRSDEDEIERRPVRIEQSLSIVVAICNDMEWSESEKHDSDSW